jgi:DNA end-binding protein Ku
MTARAMWKAELHVDKLRVRVKLYAAVADKSVHFRLLHAADQQPVKQQMVDPATDEPVPSEQIRRGVEVERGVFVLLNPDEQTALEPKPSRDITVERIVDAARVDERWFDRPYYLGPDDRAAERYFALAQALEARAAIGVAHWTMRKKAYIGALHAHDGYLMLETLRHTQEVVAIGAVRPPASRAPDQRELALAEQLVGTLEDRFDPSAYRDEHRERVLALLDAKAKGKVVRFPKAAHRKEQGSLVAELQASLKAGGKRAGRGR